MKTIQIWLQLDHIILLFKNAGVSSKKYVSHLRETWVKPPLVSPKNIHSTQVWRKFRADDRLFNLPSAHWQGFRHATQKAERTGGGVPYTNSAVLRRGGQPLAVRRYGQCKDFVELSNASRLRTLFGTKFSLAAPRKSKSSLLERGHVKAWVGGREHRE